MKLKKSIFILLAISFVCFGVVELYQYYTGNIDANFALEPPNFTRPKNGDELLTEEEMKADLTQLKKDLEEVHPKTIEGLPPEMEEAFISAFEKIKVPMTVNEFALLASELATLMEDAHTAVNNIMGGGYNAPLPIRFKRIGEDFYVISGNDLEPKDQLVALGGIPIEELYEFFKKIIPAENEYWYNYRFERTIITPTALAQAGAKIEENTVDVLVNRDGTPLTVSLSFGDVIFESIDKSASKAKRYITYPPNSLNVPYRYYIDEENDLLHFKLTQCIDSPEYRTFLKLMFEDLHSKNINNIVVDVRGNPGGNSSVVNEFLKYLDVDRFVTYGSTRRLSQQSSEQRAFQRTSGTIVHTPGYTKNNPVNGELFTGNVYGLIDNGTFSSANWFGVVLADSGIGTLVGEPSGNAPSSYGDILSFQLPNSRLIYSISYTQWVRPNEEKRNDDALYPDVEVKYTLDDYIENRDLALEAVIKLIKEK